MTSSAHLDWLKNILEDLLEINRRIECGDIVSAKAAIASSRVKKLLGQYHKALTDDGAKKVFLEAYVAAGGWIGITYSFELGDGFKVEGSPVPRPVR
jgi:hypothetical protein